MKKLMGVVTMTVAFALVVCLAGCSGGDNSDSNDSSTSATEQSSGDTEQSYYNDEQAEDEVTTDISEDNNNEADETSVSNSDEDGIETTEDTPEDNLVDAEDIDYVASFDQPETLGGISFDIPEDWKKIESENYTNYYTSDFVVNGIVIDSDPNEEGEPLTAEEYNEMYISQNTDVDSGYTVDTEMIQTREIDGCTCTIYKYVGQSSTMPEENDQGCFAFIDTPGDNYIIQFLGSSSVSVVNSLLDTLIIN